MCYSIQDQTLRKYILEHYLEKIKNLTPNQKYGSFVNKRTNYKPLSETKKMLFSKEHLTKEEIKEYSILYVMFNYPEIISPRLEILEEIQLSSNKLNNMKNEILSLISKEEFNDDSKIKIKNEYSNYVNDINQNSVVRNIFEKKNDDQKVELLNEILRELNEIKFSKKIDKLEEKLIKQFDEKSYSDLIQLKNRVNKD